MRRLHNGPESNPNLFEKYEHYRGMSCEGLSQCIWTSLVLVRRPIYLKPKGEKRDLAVVDAVKSALILSLCPPAKLAHCPSAARFPEEGRDLTREGPRFNDDTRQHVEWSSTRKRTNEKRKEWGNIA